VYDLLLTLHLLAAIAWFGGGITLHVIARRAIASGDGERVLQFVRDAGWIGPRLYAPLSIVLLIAGILLVSEAGYSYGDPWVTIGFAGWAITFFIGVALYGPPTQRAEQAAASGGPSDPGVVASARRLATVNSIELTVLLLVLIDMVVKPGL
jgi:uncharacterized membrane protein